MTLIRVNTETETIRRAEIALPAYCYANKQYRRVLLRAGVAGSNIKKHT